MKTALIVLAVWLAIDLLLAPPIISIMITAAKIFGGVLIFNLLLAVWLYMRPDAKPRKANRLGES